MNIFKRYGWWYFMGGLALAAIAVWGAVFRVEAHRGKLFLHVLDVGQGDAVFIETPNGNQALIDGGPGNSVLMRLGEVMPFGDRSIDLVVLTHPHADHLDGLLSVLERYEIGMVLESGVYHSTPDYEAWRKMVREKNIPRVRAQRGQKIDLGEGIFFLILAPGRSYDGIKISDIHDSVIAAKLYFGNSSALLMSDAEIPLEKALIAYGDDIAAQVLKVGHHGSRTSSSELFLKAIRPRFAVISSGRNNRYGHPHQEVIDRLLSLGVRVLRTDGGGTQTFMSEGSAFEYEK